MTLLEISDSLAHLSRQLQTLSDQVDHHRQRSEADHRYLHPQDVLRGPGRLSTVSIGPGYQNATLILQMSNDQTLEVCLSVADSLLLHEELTSMVKRAGSQPLEARP